MFDTETGTWECGRLAYCFQDPDGAQEIAWRREEGRETTAKGDWVMERRSSVRGARVLGSGS